MTTGVGGSDQEVVRHGEKLSHGALFVPLRLNPSCDKPQAFDYVVRLIEKERLVWLRDPISQLIRTPKKLFTNLSNAPNNARFVTASDPFPKARHILESVIQVLGGDESV